MVIDRSLVGKKFGKLRVKKFFKKILGTSQWECVCICGNETIASTDCLKNGKMKSCGDPSKVHHVPRRGKR